MPERATDRLLRLLGMVTYLGRSDGVSVEELAEQFGVTAEQVLADVDTLWVSGTPGYLPGDLIDFDATSYERGVVRLTESRGIARPLRLGSREAVSLVAAMRAMTEAWTDLLGPEQRAVLASALEKLTAATGEGAAAVHVELARDGAPEVVAAVRTATAEGRRLWIRYVNAADVVSEREVDPIRVAAGSDHTYLLAWCHTVADDRMFRVDRILDARVVDLPVEDHPRPQAPGGAGADVGGGEIFRPEPDDDLVVLRLASPARWVAEDVPVESVEDHPDGSFTVALRIAQPSWLRHLLLSLAPQVLAVAPPQATEDAAEQARCALVAYGPLADGSGPGGGQPTRDRHRA